ncbi:molybdate ABC transporter substrate-binding protein [Novosphingobium sp.]|uniref:molybdate ABC transporter substrate-binding protein n=1 Tax=Novosphingobium sp. TaxID=1874826 RepID=UPI0025CD3FA1|nr:molybdate ABC transporter substrate-binding protein [Novosphingobium sp.]
MLRLLTALIALLALTPPALAATAPTVLAAASLQEALTEAADAFARARHPRPVLAFAASSALARQVQAGAPADMFVSADEQWMDALAAKRLIVAASRRDLVTNALVLIEPAAGSTRLAIARGFPLARALGASGRLALADPAAVPAGIYAKAALTSLGVWPSVAGRIAAAENVRAAMALVEHGQAPLGIVYATDALASAKVRVVARFPSASHPRIVYPVALIAPINGRAANPEAEAFRRFLLGREGQAILRRHGFGPA